jgi:hypothetical protein
MNTKEALAAFAKMPHIFSHLGQDLGQRVSVGALEGATFSEAKLTVRDRFSERIVNPPRTLLLKCSTDAVALIGDVTSQPEMSMLAEVLHDAVPGSGPVRTDKRDDGLFCVGFAIPQPETAATPSAQEPRASRRAERTTATEGNQ